MCEFCQLPTGWYKMPPREGPSAPHQVAHDKLIREYRNRFQDLIEEQGESNPREWHRRMDSLLAELHTELYTLGIEHGGGSVNAEAARAFGRMMADTEGQWLLGFLSDLEDGRYADENGRLDLANGALAQRLDLYALKGSASASYGLLETVTDEDDIYWRNGHVEEHCLDCPYLQEASPWKRSELFTVPRACDTPCLSLCKCRLEFRRQDGATLQGFGPLSL